MQSAAAIKAREAGPRQGKGRERYTVHSKLNKVGRKDRGKSVLAAKLLRSYRRCRATGALKSVLFSRLVNTFSIQNQESEILANLLQSERFRILLFWDLTRTEDYHQSPPRRAAATFTPGEQGVKN